LSGESSEGRKEGGARFFCFFFINYKIYIYLVACTAHENTFTCYKVYATSGSVQQEQAGGRGWNIDDLGGPNK
jgi:hypothetical protein